MKIFERIGNKKLDVKYESGLNFEINYLPENELRWVACHTLEEGEVSDAIEKYYEYEISDGIYNINWIEEDGLTVSQILDFNTNTIIAFLTWFDENGRGNRSSVIQKGKFNLID